MHILNNIHIYIYIVLCASLLLHSFAMLRGVKTTVVSEYVSLQVVGPTTKSQNALSAITLPGLGPAIAGSNRTANRYLKKCVLFC